MKIIPELFGENKIMDEILRLIEELPSDDEKIALLEEIYSYGFEDGKNKINEQFAEAISQILKIRNEI